MHGTCNCRFNLLIANVLCASAYFLALVKNIFLLECRKEVGVRCDRLKKIFVIMARVNERHARNAASTSLHGRGNHHHRRQEPKRATSKPAQPERTTSYKVVYEEVEEGDRKKKLKTLVSCHLHAFLFLGLVTFDILRSYIPNNRPLLDTPSYQQEILN